MLKKKGDLIAELPEDIKVQEIPLPKEIEDELLYGRKKALIQTLKKGKIIQVFKKIIDGLRMLINTKSDVGRRVWYYKSIKNKIYAQIFCSLFSYAASFSALKKG